MKYIIFCLSCCLFYTCQPTVEESVEVEAVLGKQDTSTVEPDIKKNTVCEEVPEPIDSHNFYYQPRKNSKALQRFLSMPIDLPKFKKKNGANSTTLKRASYYLKPKEKGFYYHYFLFRGCYETGLVINVYMYGDRPGSYSKANETLVDLKCRCELTDLKALNLVGKEWAEIKEKYGDNYLKRYDKRIYAHQGNLLLINLRRAKISSYRYVRTNLKHIQSIDDIPEELLERD